MATPEACLSWIMPSLACHWASRITAPQAVPPERLNELLAEPLESEGNTSRWARSPLSVPPCEVSRLRFREPQNRVCRRAEPSAGGPRSTRRAAWCSVLLTTSQNTSPSDGRLRQVHHARQLGPIGARTQFRRVQRCGVDRRKNSARRSSSLAPAGRLRDLRAQQMVPGAAPERSWSVTHVAEERVARSFSPRRPVWPQETRCPWTAVGDCDALAPRRQEPRRCSPRAR